MKATFADKKSRFDKLRAIQNNNRAQQDRLDHVQMYTQYWINNYNYSQYLKRLTSKSGNFWYYVEIFFKIICFPNKMY